VWRFGENPESSAVSFLPTRLALCRLTSIVSELAILTEMGRSMLRPYIRTARDQQGIDQ